MSQFNAQNPVPTAAVQVGSAQPIDDIIAKLMETVARKGRGFILGTAVTDGIVGVEVKESLPPHDDWLPPADYRAHRLETTESFINYATRYGNKDKSLVFFHADGCALVIDEQVEKGGREVVTLKLPLSADWSDWTALLASELEHRDLLKFLFKHETNLLDPTILLAMSSVKATSTVNYESDINDDGKSVGIMFKTQAGEELKRFPKQFGIRLPVLQSDEGGDRYETATLRLEIAMPDGPNEKPTFTLYCSNWRSILKARIQKEGESIGKALTGWTVVHGQYATLKHELAGK